MPPAVQLNRPYVALLSLVVRHAGRPDIRVRMVLYANDDWMDLYHLTHRMLRRARQLDPTFRIDEVHWRVVPHVT